MKLRPLSANTASTPLHTIATPASAGPMNRARLKTMLLMATAVARSERGRRSGTSASRAGSTSASPEGAPTSASRQTGTSASRQPGTSDSRVGDTSDAAEEALLRLHVDERHVEVARERLHHLFGLVLAHRLHGVHAILDRKIVDGRIVHRRLHHDVALDQLVGAASVPLDERVPVGRFAVGEFTELKTVQMQLRPAQPES